MNNEVKSIVTEIKTEEDWNIAFAKMCEEAEARAKEERVLALQKTADEMRALRDMLRGLELPMDSLPTALAIYKDTLHRVQHPAIFPRMSTARVPMPVISKDKEYRSFKIKPGTLHQVTTRPQWGAMRVEEIEILSNPEHWTVHDIKIGNRSQFVVCGDVPGRLFGPDGMCKKFVTETIQVAMDFDMIVSYIGPDPDGEVFEATCMGSAVV